MDFLSFSQPMNRVLLIVNRPKSLAQLNQPKPVSVTISLPNLVARQFEIGLPKIEEHESDEEVYLPQVYALCSFILQISLLQVGFY